MGGLIGRVRAVQDALDVLARRHGVPGATLAIAEDGELLDFATGVLNVDTGVATTTDSGFQIGSNTKLFTATLLMQLVDAGDVDLDAPVRRYLEGFALADEGAAAGITVRQLLTHTSGIEGDHFEEFGRGEEGIARYVDSLAALGAVHPPGAHWSYCNAGFVVAGRVAEVVTGLPYHRLFKERICQPLGLARTTVLAEEMIASRCAVGHVPGEGGKPVLPPVVLMAYSAAPAGAVTVATAAELTRFVRMHLDVAAGRVEAGEAVLSRQAATAMTEVQAARPSTTASPEAMGIGWMLEEWSGKRVIGHGGGTIGQMSFLEAIPEERLVVVLLTNSTSGGRLWHSLAPWLFEQLAGVEMAETAKAADPPPPVATSPYVGTYQRLGQRQLVSAEGGELALRIELSGAFAELNKLGDLPPMRLRPIDEHRFAFRYDGVDEVAIFVEVDRKANYLFTGGRMAKRVTRAAPRRTASAAPPPPPRARRQRPRPRG